MDESFPPRVSCIYQIRCRTTGRIYIGSAVDLRDRWNTHLRNLRRGDHSNALLQQAWNKHGETSFELSILELVEKVRLLHAEQAWLDGSGCTDRRLGFNLSTLACSGGQSLAATWTGFRDPAGQPVTIVNLHDFCRQHRLDFPSMHRLAKGRSKLKSYKGWTHENSIRRRDYIKSHAGFIDPHGRPTGTIINLAAFCRRNGLAPTHMVAVANGRICSHRGWTHQNGRKALTPKTFSGFVSPAGECVIITNLSAFCRLNGLSVVHMHFVKSGTRRSHKGWTWRD